MSEVKTELMTGSMADGIANRGIITDIISYSISEVLYATMRTLGSDSLCTCNVCVICTKATEDSVPHHMKSGDGLIHMGHIEELNRTNIEINKNFEGCKMSADGKCYIAEKYKEWIADEEWKEVDESSSQGEEKENLNKDTSYMVCVEHGGIIYFYDDGQELQPYINGEAILCLSNDYIKWLNKAENAEGYKEYPYICEGDNQVAIGNRTVTLGIGFTICEEKVKGEGGDWHWDMLSEVLEWDEDKIRRLIDGIYTEGQDFFKDDEYKVTYEKALELLNLAAEREYMPSLNDTIKAYNAQQSQTTTYTQRELEAMFDYAYNNGLGEDSIDNQNQVIYYYLGKNQEGAVNAVKTWKSDNRRRLNQMNLFFIEKDEAGYNFLDAKESGLDPLRESLGFFDTKNLDKRKEEG